MLKKFIAPIQTWLLSQNRCVGCGTPLKQGTKQRGKSGEVIKCTCKRLYVLDTEKKEYRRALLSEV